MQNKILAFFLFACLKSYSQTNDSCDLWSQKPYHKTIDTLTVIVKFLGTVEDRYEHIIKSNDSAFAFYKKIQKRFNLLDKLLFQPVECNKIYSYPNSYKKKYGTKLYHKANKNGVYEDIEIGSLLEIKCIRFNRTYKDSPELITIITEIKILNTSSPVMVPR